MRDVANLVGVSVMTVSRVLHDDPRISEETKRRVREAVDHLRYLRNDTARNLRIGRGAGAVGLVIKIGRAHV
jgi:LacI family transcriptional regulator